METQAQIFDGNVIELSETVYVALRVIAGEYGNNQERVNRLKKEGYNPSVIQECVNDLIELRDRYF